MENNVEEALSQVLPQALEGSKLSTCSQVILHARMYAYGCALNEVHLMKSQLSNELFLITSLT